MLHFCEASVCSEKLSELLLSLFLAALHECFCPRAWVLKNPGSQTLFDKTTPQRGVYKPVFGFINRLGQDRRNRRIWLFFERESLFFDCGACLVHQGPLKQYTRRALEAN